MKKVFSPLIVVFMAIIIIPGLVYAGQCEDNCNAKYLPGPKLTACLGKCVSSSPTPVAATDTTTGKKKKRRGGSVKTPVVMKELCAYTGTEMNPADCPEGCPVFYTLEDGKCTPPACEQLLCVETLDDALDAKLDAKLKGHFDIFNQRHASFPLWYFWIIFGGIGLNFLLLVILLIRSRKKKNENPKSLTDDPATRETTHLGPAK